MAESFPIRGHHLHNFADLVSWRATPAILADTVIEGRLHDREGGADEQAYARDVIGDTPYTESLVRNRHRAVFERFAGLETEDMILITTGERDLLCQGCIIGNHCVERGEEMVAETEHGPFQVYEKDLLDMKAIRAFHKLADRLKKENGLDPALGAPEVADMPRPTPAATPIPAEDRGRVALPFQAPAGYIKAVLQHWTLAQRLEHFS